MSAELTQDQQTLLMIKGAIADLPDTQRKAVNELAKELIGKIQDNPILGMAIALVGAELQVLG